MLRRIRINADLFDVPILMLTGRRSKSDVDIAYQAGTNAYLKKPFEPEELQMIVADLLLKAKERAEKAKPASRYG